MNEVLEAKKVSKHFGTLEAVHNVSFTLKNGSFVALLGPSGCGKSTFLALLSGIERPSAGEVFLDGQALGGLGEDELALMRREKVGIVFQSFNLIPTLSALENIAFPLYPVRLTAHDKKDRAMSALQSVGLADRVANRPAELSGGEQQRVAIARATINNPKVILADEPTGNLDSAMGREVIGLLATLSRERGMALLVATHDQEMAQAAEKIIVMKDGGIVGYS